MTNLFTSPNYAGATNRCPLGILNCQGTENGNLTTLPLSRTGGRLHCT